MQVWQVTVVACLLPLVLFLNLEHSLLHFLLFHCIVLKKVLKSLPQPMQDMLAHMVTLLHYILQQFGTNLGCLLVQNDIPVRKEH